MASTAYRRVYTFSPGGYAVYLDSRTTANFSRTNNTVSVTGAKVDVRFNSSSVGASFTGFNIVGSYSLPQGTTRRSNVTISSGTWNRGDVKSTAAQSFSVTVGMNDTTITTNNGAGHDSTTWGGGQTLTIPALGAPTGSSITSSAITTTGFTLNASISGWGTNATAGSGQRIEYNENGGAWTNLAYSTATSHSRAVTGKTSNQKYQARTYASNGGGKTQNSSTITLYTLPLSCTMGTITFDATTATVPISQNTGGGAYAITKQYRWRKTGGTFGAWTTISGSTVNLTGLIPSTKYYIEVRSTTTAGTTTGATKDFTTLPAVKLVMPDGTTKNAIPWVIGTNGVKTMVKVRQV